MQALIFPQYGSYQVLEVRSMNCPQIQEGEYLIKVHYSSLTTAESMMRRANPCLVRLMLGLLRPKHNISGACFAGTVIQDGKRALAQNEQFAIFGEIGAQLGANADYIKVKKSATIMPKPKTLGFKQAACLCDGTITSFYFVSKLMQANAGDKILIHGATGSLGLAAIQLAKLKRMNVTAVCSASNFDLVKKYGADHTLSYQQSDYLQQLTGYDFVFDCVGKIPLDKLNQMMQPHGQYYTPVISGKALFRQLKNIYLKQKVYFAAVGMLSPKILQGLLGEITQLIESKQLEIPVTQVFHFKNVIEAHKLIDSGHKTGNFVLKHSS